jgi:hypothetical protein
MATLVTVNGNQFEQGSVGWNETRGQLVARRADPTGRLAYEQARRGKSDFPSFEQWQENTQNYGGGTVLVDVSESQAEQIGYGSEWVRQPEQRKVVPDITEQALGEIERGERLRPGDKRYYQDIRTGKTYSTQKAAERAILARGGRPSDIQVTGSPQRVIVVPDSNIRRRRRTPEEKAFAESPLVQDILKEGKEKPPVIQKSEETKISFWQRPTPEIITKGLDPFLEKSGTGQLPFLIVGKEIVRRYEKKPFKEIAIAGGIALAAITPVPDEFIIGGFVGKAVIKGANGAKVLATATVGSAAGVEVSKEVGARTAPKAQQEIIKREDFSEALKIGFETEFAAFSRGTGYKKGIEQYYQEQGYSKEEAKELAKIAVKDPEEFYSDLGYTGEELKAQTRRARTMVNEAWYKRYSQTISIVPLFAGKPEEFKKGVREFYKERGLEGKELETAVAAAERQRKARLIGEGVGVAFANIGSEIVGRRLVSSAFKNIGRTTSKQAGTQLFKTGFVQIGKAGVVEGVAAEVATQQAREQDTDIGQIAIAGGAGFLTAGLIGGSIAGTALKRPFLSKAITAGAYVTDPFEITGDIGVTTIQKGLKIPVAATPVVFDTTAAKEQVIFGTKEGDVQVPTPPFKPGREPREQRPMDIRPESIVPDTPVTPPEQPIIDITPIARDDVAFKPPIFAGRGKSKAVPITLEPQLPVEIPPQQPVQLPPQIHIIAPPAPFPTDPFVPTPPIDTPVQVPPGVPVTPPTPPIIPTQIPARIPTPVSRVLIPPPVPLGLNLGGRGRGFLTGRGSKFINELAAGGFLLQKQVRGAKKARGFFFGDFKMPSFAPPKVKPVKQKKTKTKGRKSTQGNVFDPMSLFFG